MVSAELPHVDSGSYPSDLELSLLQIVHRHGERTPVRKRLEKLFPAVWTMCDANSRMMATIIGLDKDAENKRTKSFVPLKRLVDAEDKDGSPKTFEEGSCYFGQLTNLGRNNMALLGARLREIYINRLKFLPDVYDDKAIYIRSTDYTRTQESVQQLVAAGLYPPGKRNDDFELKIRTRDPISDNLFPNPHCYRLRELAKQFNGEVAEMFKEKLASISDRLKNHVKNVSLDSHPSANGILDTLISARTHGFPMPPEVDEQLLKDLEEVVVMEWFYGNMISQEMRRLSMGRLMGDIRDRMVARANGSDRKTGAGDRKLYLYSGHDTTVAPLLIILGAYDKRWPPFGSAVIFELFKQKSGESSWWNSLFRKQKEQHYVRVRYNDKILELPGCAGQGDHHASGDKSLCTLEAFKKIVKDQIPDNWAAECRAN